MKNRKAVRSTVYQQRHGKLRAWSLQDLLLELFYTTHKEETCLRLGGTEGWYHYIKKNMTSRSADIIEV